MRVLPLAQNQIISAQTLAKPKEISTSTTNFRPSNAAVPVETLKAYSIMPKISFGRTIKEHMRYLGANYDSETKETTFRIWAQPDHVNYDKGITLQIIPVENIKNNPKLHNIIRNVNSDIPEKLVDFEEVLNIPMALSKDKKEVFEAKVNNIPPGSFYRFVFNSNKDSEHSQVKANDPRAYYLPYGIEGWGSVLDDAAYKFKHSRPKQNDTDPVLIYEASIAALTKKGDFESAIPLIKNIADKGYSHIEIMPPWQSVGKGWGYAALPFAISKDLCGDKDTPDDFKLFVDTCHKHNLNVIVDVNHNHLTEGFSGNHFAQYSSKDNKTDWGDAHNYENSNVRNFAIDDIIRFIVNYNIDGLRFDSVHCMTNGIMRQINLEIEGHSLKGDFSPETKILKIGEDYNLRPTGTQAFSNAELQTYYDNPEKFNYETNNENLVLGLDAAVNLDSHHLNGNITQQITEANGIDGAIASNIEKMHKQGKSYEPYPIEKLVNCLSAHDDIQDMSGTRLITKGIISQLNMSERVYVDPAKVREYKPLDMCKRRIASNVTQDLIESYKKSGGKSILNEKEQASLGITLPVRLEEFEKAHQYSVDLTKVAIANHMLMPGKYKMNFMGDEEGVISPFKLFLDSHDRNIVKDTSEYFEYDISPKIAIPQSNLEQSNYNNRTDSIANFHNKLMELFKENPAFKYRHEAERYWYNDNDNVIEIGYKKGNKKIFAVTNLGNTDFTEYGIQLTQGRWKEAINSNDEQFGGNGSSSNSSQFFKSDGTTKDWGNTPIKLGARSVIIFERID